MVWGSPKPTSCRCFWTHAQVDRLPSPVPPSLLQRPQSGMWATADLGWVDARNTLRNVWWITDQWYQAIVPVPLENPKSPNKEERGELGETKPEFFQWPLKRNSATFAFVFDPEKSLEGHSCVRLWLDGREGMVCFQQSCLWGPCGSVTPSVWPRAGTSGARQRGNSKSSSSSSRFSRSASTIWGSVLPPHPATGRGHHQISTRGSIRSSLKKNPLEFKHSVCIPLESDLLLNLDSSFWGGKPHYLWLTKEITATERTRMVDGEVNWEALSSPSCLDKPQLRWLTAAWADIHVPDLRRSSSGLSLILTHSSQGSPRSEPIGKAPLWRALPLPPQISTLFIL